MQILQPNFSSCNFLSIKQSLPAHLQLLTASKDHPGDTLREIEYLLINYERMWKVFSEFLFLMKTPGYIDDDRLVQIEECYPRFCLIYESVVKPDVEPPLKNILLSNAICLTSSGETGASGVYPREDSRQVTAC